MNTIKKHIGKDTKPPEADFFKRFWEGSSVYIKAVTDVLEAPILILDEGLRVIAANESFYRTFQVTLKSTEGEDVYNIGNGQWNIPALRELLEDILPKNSFFKGFQVAHEFPLIGRRVMILNGRKLNLKEKDSIKEFPPVIVLAIEDITEMMVVAESIADYSNQMEEKLIARTQRLEIQIGILEKEIAEFKKKLDNS